VTAAPIAEETLRRHTAAANLLKLDALADVLSAFQKNAVPCVLLKGAALLLTVYDHPGDRPMTDVDVWTPFHGLDAVEDTLLPLGFAPAPGRPGVYERGLLRLDVATALWFLPPADATALWARRRAAGMEKTAAVLSNEDAFLYCVAHGLIHHAQWDERWTEDLRRLSAGDGFDWNAVLRDASRWGLVEALWETAALGPVLFPAGVTAALAAGRRSWRGRLLRAVGRLEVSGKGHLLRLLLLRGAGMKARFLWRQLFPPADFLRRRYRGPALLFALARPFLLLAALGRFFRRRPGVSH